MNRASHAQGKNGEAKKEGRDTKREQLHTQQRQKEEKKRRRVA